MRLILIIFVYDIFLLLYYNLLIHINLEGTVYWIFKNIIRKYTEKSKTRFDDIILKSMESPVVFGVVIAGIYFAFNVLTFSEKVSASVKRGINALIIFDIAWVLSRLLDGIIEEYITPLIKKTESDLDDQLLPIIRKGIKMTIWIVAVIVALDNAGYDVGAILAGLGIGGFAFALAAQDYISNLFGGITIFLDKPFTVNERIKVNGVDGVIKEIGIRSSRIETLEGRIVTIPNSVFSKSSIENVSSEPSRKVVMNIGVTYDTKPEKIQRAIDILKEIAKLNTNLDEKVIVSFNEFKDFSLNIIFVYYIKKGSDIFGTQNEMNLEILKRFNENAIEFAFPTQTLYTKNS